MARNPNTPPKTLNMLATDKDWLVRTYVAMNPNTLTKTLTILATDCARSARYYVGRHPNSTELIKRLVLMTNTQQDKKSLSTTT